MRSPVHTSLPQDRSLQNSKAFRNRVEVLRFIHSSVRIPLQPMKFRAKITKDCLVTLYNVIITFERIATCATIYLDEESVRISLISESIDSPKCFAELNAINLFSEYRIESQSANTILFEINLNQFSKALASGKVASQSQLKLVKRDDRPCLCFETKADESILSVDVYHDIPLKLMKSNEMVHFMPPDMPQPSVALDLPKGKLIKTIVDKMTKFAKHVQITANQSGRLALRADHSSVIINTYYPGLLARYVGDMNPTRDINNQVVCKLNLRKLSTVLNMHHLAVEHATLFFAANEGVVLVIQLEPARLGSLSFYLPILLLDQEEEEGFEQQQQQQQAQEAD